MKLLSDLIEGAVALCIVGGFFYFIYCVMAVICSIYALGFIVALVFIIKLFDYLEDREFWRN